MNDKNGRKEIEGGINQKWDLSLKFHYPILFCSGKIFAINKFKYIKFLLVRV